MSRWTKEDQRQLGELRDRAARQGMRDTDAAEHAAENVGRARGKSPATDRKSAGRGAERPLDHRTVEELQLLARQRKIPGRSRMNRAELIEALKTEATR